MNIFWDIQGQQLIPGLNGGGAITLYTVVLRDVWPVSLYLCAEQSNINVPYAVSAITSGHAVKFGAKSALTATTYLSEQATWTSAGSGSTQRYEASIPLDGAALIAAMTGLMALDLIAEFTTRDADGNEYLSTQFNITVVPDVITGSES